MRSSLIFELYTQVAILACGDGIGFAVNGVRCDAAALKRCTRGRPELHQEFTPFLPCFIRDSAKLAVFGLLIKG